MPAMCHPGRLLTREQVAPEMLPKAPRQGNSDGVVVHAAAPRMSITCSINAGLLRLPARTCIIRSSMGRAVCGFSTLWTDVSGDTGHRRKVAGMGTGLGRYVVDAVLLEGRSVREVAAAHGISKTWIYELIARYRSGGYGALEPRSRRPRSCLHGTSPEMVQAIVELRRQLQAEGHDAGAETIAYHLAQRLEGVSSRTTIWRILGREGL